MKIMLDEKDRKLLGYLQENARISNAELARRVNLKFMPQLRFKVDVSFESSARIDTILASPKVARDLDE